jgi:hypothetical protein
MSKHVLLTRLHHQLRPHAFFVDMNQLSSQFILNQAIPRTTAVRLLNYLGSVGPFIKCPPDASFAARIGRRFASGRNAVQAQGKLSGNTASSLGVQGQGIPVDVLDSVAAQVVARIGRGSSASKEAGRGDS